MAIHWEALTGKPVLACGKCTGDWVEWSMDSCKWHCVTCGKPFKQEELEEYAAELEKWERKQEKLKRSLGEGGDY